MLSSVGIGIVNLIFTFVGLALIDNSAAPPIDVYRLVWLYYFFGLGIAGLFSCTGKAWRCRCFFFLFIAAHAIGQGTVIWVFISETFPATCALKANRSAAPPTGCWPPPSPAAIPFLFDSIGAAWVFVVFTAMMVLQLLFVMFMMPETKGVPLEESSKSLIKEDAL